MRDELGFKIGAKVKALRAERGLSGRKLAAAADVSQPFLSQLEAGRTSVAIATLYRLATALDVKPSDLLPDPPTDTRVDVLRASELNQMPVSELPNATTARAAYRGGRRITELGDFWIEPGPDVILQQYFPKNNIFFSNGFNTKLHLALYSFKLLDKPVILTF